MNTLERKHKLASISRDCFSWSVFHRDREDGDAQLLSHVMRLTDKSHGLKVLEIGTCRCVGSVILCDVADLVYTLDVASYPEQQKVLDAFQCGPRVVRLVGPASLTRPLIAHMRFDVVFVDADHSHESTVKDFEFALTVSDAVIVHDNCEHNKGVMSAVAELQERHPGDWHFEGVFATYKKPIERINT